MKHDSFHDFIRYRFSIISFEQIFASCYYSTHCHLLNLIIDVQIRNSWKCSSLFETLIYSYVSLKNAWKQTKSFEIVIHNRWNNRWFSWMRNCSNSFNYLSRDWSLYSISYLAEFSVEQYYAFFAQYLSAEFVSKYVCLIETCW
jgi:hypothetical protein